MREPTRTVHRRAVVAGGAAFGAILLSCPGAVAAGRQASAVPAFATDIRLPGLLHAVVARPPMFGARLVDRDAAQALCVRGVVAVVELAPSPGPALARLGGIAVLARDTWAALKGRDALRLTWSDARDEPAGRDAAFAEDRFVPETAEPLMEPPCAVVRAGADSCAAWACLRAPERARVALAARLGLRAEAVAFHAAAPACGPDRFSDPAYLFEAARLSRAMHGAPVSLVWTRADDIPFRVRPPEA